MNFPSHIWDQLKNISAKDLISALKRAGWTRDAAVGSAQIFLSPDGKRRVSIHFHPGKTFGAKLLKALLDDIGWTEKELRNLRMIK